MTRHAAFPISDGPAISIKAATQLRQDVEFCRARISRLKKRSISTLFRRSGYEREMKEIGDVLHLIWSKTARFSKPQRDELYESTWSF